jgi:DNA-binding NtrC family response regulator
MSSGSFRIPGPLSGSLPPARSSSGSFRAAGSERYRVLVVDDEPLVLLSLQSVLSNDADLMTCESAERALELLKDNAFHVVVSDLVLPGMNGNELFRIVRDIPEYTSCLLITGSDRYEQPRDKERHYVLLKPFDPERLVTLVIQLGRVAQMKRAVQRLGSSVGGKAD